MEISPCRKSEFTGQCLLFMTKPMLKSLLHFLDSRGKLRNGWNWSSVHLTLQLMIGFECFLRRILVLQLVQMNLVHILHCCVLHRLSTNMRITVVQGTKIQGKAP